MAKKRMLVVICAMGLAALSATCVGKLPSTQRSQAQGSEVQGSLVHGAETSVRATGLTMKSVRVVGGQLVGER